MNKGIEMAEDNISFEKEQAEFNSSLALLQRIHEIKKALIVATVDSNYELQYKMIKAYYKEMVQILKEDEEAIEKEHMKKITDNYYTYMVLINKGKKFFPRELIESFDEQEIRLRNLEQKYGMGMRKKDDARFAMASKR